MDFDPNDLPNSTSHYDGQNTLYFRKVAGLIQRSVEDIEYGMRMDMAAAAIEFVHNQIDK